MEPTRVVFLVYPNVTQLDLTGPAQVLSRFEKRPRRSGLADTRSGPDRQRLRFAADGHARRDREGGHPVRAGRLRLRRRDGGRRGPRLGAEHRRERAVGDQRLHRVADPRSGRSAARLSGYVPLGLAGLSHAVRCGAGRGARRVRPQSRDRRRCHCRHRLRACADGRDRRGGICPCGAVGSRVRSSSAVRRRHARQGG